MGGSYECTMEGGREVEGAYKGNRARNGELVMDTLCPKKKEKKEKRKKRKNNQSPSQYVYVTYIKPHYRQEIHHTRQFDTKSNNTAL